MITLKNLFASALLLSSLLSYSQRQMVFFGSYNWDKNKPGLYVYELNHNNGKLKKITSLKGVVNPSYLTVSANGKYIYSVTDSKLENEGSVSSFAFDEEKGSLQFLNKQKSYGENPVYVSVDKSEKWLANANYTEGSVSIYPILENGKIGELAQNITYYEGSRATKRQMESHVHSVVFSPNNDQLLLADLGADEIKIYPFNSANKKPLDKEKVSIIKTVSGSGPRHLLFNKKGDILYGIEEISGTISVFKYENKTLIPIQKIATHPESLLNGFEASDIHISPDNRFVYASNRGSENNLAIFKILSNGKLEHVGYQSVHGKHPRIFAIDETGNFVIVTNVKTQNVVVFRRNTETGLLKKVGRKIRITNASCVKTKIY
ncbi:lactonase family protein [Chryseobacterium sp.]|uniref:lactonase family protein n=1 Tax=Chryseobacterium sp. TaxID=1871047 RepID=UPI00388F1BD1